MISKASDVYYLFDFDGTLFGENKWKGYWYNTKAAWRNGPYINPTDYDIRWSVLTGRPLIDIPFIWLTCTMNELYPESIITLPTMLYPKSYTDVAILNHKLSKIKNILDNNNQSIGRVISKVFYIDNDLDSITYINRNRGNMCCMGLSVFDFKNQNFNLYV